MIAYYRRIFSASMLAYNAANNVQDICFSAWNKLGLEKKLVLRDFRKKIDVTPKKMTLQFNDLMTKIKKINDSEGINLERFYKNLQKEHGDYEKKINKIHDKLEAADYLAQELFKEWKGELGQISKTRLKLKSSTILETTQKDFAEHLRTLTAEESKGRPILKTLNDYVLYLKHQLNTKLADNLFHEMGELKAEIEALNAAMIESGKAAKSFAEIQKSTGSKKKKTQKAAPKRATSKS